MTTSTLMAAQHRDAAETEDPAVSTDDVVAAPTTVVPRRNPSAGVPTRRDVGRVSKESLMVAGGAAVSALSTTLLLFGRLTPLSGAIGFTVVAFIMFLGTYALLVSLTDDGPAVVDRVMGSLLAAAAVLAGFALLSVIVFIFARGWGALTNVNLYVEDMSRAGPLDPLSVGGVAHAMMGSLLIMLIALAITVPLGIACAVFLNETGGRSTELVRTIVTAMTALPSILAGLFILSTWILILGFPRSGLAAALAISIMVLPIIIRSADLVLRLVPGSLREAAAATGAPQWRTVWHVVLPTARSGLANAVILGLARGVGETAPVLLVSGIANSTNVDPTQNPMMSLPLAVFEFVRSPQPEQVARGFATAAVLLILVLILFILARILGGRPAGQLSPGQTRRAANRSARDFERITKEPADAALSPEVAT